MRLERSLGERSYVALALIAYALLAVGYIALTPPWENPDEPAHYNYVAFVAQTGGLPELKRGDWDSALLERVKNGTLQPGDSLSTIRYESWQPPLFYMLAAPVFKFGPSDTLATLQRLRAFDAVLGVCTLLIAYRAARLVVPPVAASIAPAVMVGVPMFTAISAGLSADPLANLLAAALVLGLLRYLQGPTPRNAAILGVLLGLGLLTKLALAIFIPLALIVVLLKARRHVALIIGIPGLLLVPWLVHQVTTYGWTDPLATARHAAVVADQPRFGGFGADYLIEFLTVSFHSFWAQFGWMAIVATPRLYWIYAAFTLAALVGLLTHRRQLNRPGLLLLGATVLAGVLAYLGYNLTFDQPQGRYLFPALVPIAIFLTLGWQALMPSRARAFGLPLVAAALVLLNVYTLFRIVVPGFAPGA